MCPHFVRMRLESQNMGICKWHYLNQTKNSNLEAFTLLEYYMAQVGRDTPQLTHQLCSARSCASWILKRSKLITHTVNQLHMNIDGGPAKIQNTMDPNWLQQDYPTACIISQQCSSTTFVSLHFHTHKAKTSMHFKNVLYIYIYFFYLSLSLKLCESEISCVRKSLELVTNYQPTPHTTPEEERPQLHHHGSMKSL